MIGMGFGSFLTVAILGLIAAGVLHYGVRYKFLPGLDGFVSKWIIAWMGAWLASPVLGHWAWRIGSVYVIPGIVGAFAGAFLVTAAMKAFATPLVATPGKAAATQPAQFEMRKAG